jgi:hypothetical protein
MATFHVSVVQLDKHDSSRLSATVYSSLNYIYTHYELINKGLRRKEQCTERRDNKNHRLVSALN